MKSRLGFARYDIKKRKKKKKKSFKHLHDVIS